MVLEPVPPLTCVVAQIVHLACILLRYTVGGYQVGFFDAVVVAKCERRVFDGAVQRPPYAITLCEQCFSIATFRVVLGGEVYLMILMRQSPFRYFLISLSVMCLSALLKPPSTVWSTR